MKKNFILSIIGTLVFLTLFYVASNSCNPKGSIADQINFGGKPSCKVK